MNEYLQRYLGLAREYFREKYGREPTKEEIIEYVADVYAEHMHLDYDTAKNIVRRLMGGGYQ